MAPTPIDWEFIDPAEEGPEHGPECLGPESHRWELLIDESGASVSSGCTDCDSWMESYMLSASLTGTLTFEHEHDVAGPCGAGSSMLCDCAHWWRFTPEPPAIPSAAQVTAYRLRPVPTEVVVDGHHWDVFVCRFGASDRWMVKAGGFDYFADADARWHDTAHRWAANADEWVATYTHPFGEAMALAERAQWTLEAGDGKTAGDVLAKHDEAKP